MLLGLARSAGLKGVLSTAGSGTLALARKLVPDAITLDLGLSDIDGWVLFDLLRHDQKTSHIPVHAERGRDGIALLEQTPDVDAALIDIMRGQPSRPLQRALSPMEWNV